MSKLHVWRAVDAFGEHYWHVAPDDKWQYSYLTRMRLTRFQDWKDAIKWAQDHHDDDFPCATCNRWSQDCCGPWETPEEHAND